jgi:hypothetical protein
VTYLFAPVLVAFALAAISLAKKGAKSPTDSAINLHVKP